MTDKKLPFPDGFLWGASTSAHQVEGGTHNDWTEWERANAQRLANTAEKRLHAQGRYIGSLPDNWETHVRQARQPDNYISGATADHYHRFAEDFDIARSLGHTCHRFSIEWSRIEPEPGVYDQREINHYRDVIAALRQRGMEPFVTLWHWTIPTWVRDQGGWLNPKIITDFTRYCATMADAFKQDVRYWITLNEPMVYASTGYYTGEWPPQQRNVISLYRVIRHLQTAHISAYQAIKRIAPETHIGIAKSNVYFEAYRGRLINHLLKKTADWWWNDRFLNGIRQHQDFIGLNNYSHNRIDYGFNRNANERVSDMGWELYPASLYHCLIDLKKYRRPIYVTESGLADAADTRRPWYLTEVLKNVHRAITDKADVRGFMYWSLLDNFEWDKGFWPRFGLVAVDYATQQRTIRPSARKYADIIRQNAIIEPGEKNPLTASAYRSKV